MKVTGIDWIMGLQAAGVKALGAFDTRRDAI